MSGRGVRKYTLNELMQRLGDAQPGSIGRPPLEAEYERRKFIWQRIAVVIAGTGLIVAIAGVIVGALHLHDAIAYLSEPGKPGD